MVLFKFEQTPIMFINLALNSNSLTRLHRTAIKRGGIAVGWSILSEVEGQRFVR
jgi:hypothetical protein